MTTPDTAVVDRSQRREWLAQRLTWAAMAVAIAVAAALGAGTIVLRGVGMYLFMLVILRMSGKRTVGQLTAFDLILLLMISELTQPIVVGSDETPGSGLLAITVFVAVDVVMGFATWRWKRLDRLVEGVPLVVVIRGQALLERLAKEHLGEDELIVAARAHGLSSVAQIELAVLEADGHISIVPRPRGRFRRVVTPRDGMRVAPPTRAAHRGQPRRNP
ncbi:MAG: DUF421 domain-containing protein [Myxococcota bacterium]